MNINYDAAADAAATEWADSFDLEVIDAAVQRVIAAMCDDGLLIRPYRDMHDICDPNAYVADAVAGTPLDEEGIYRLVAMANRVTDRYDALVVGCCMDPDHDHWEFGEPMVCVDCGAPTHYRESAGNYRHDDPDHACWLHAGGDGCKVNPS